MRKFIYMAMAIAAAASLTSCKDDDNEPGGGAGENTLVSEKAYVLTQGNFYSAIPGSLNVIDYKEQKIQLNAFYTANKRTVGDTPQCGVAYGSKLYLGAYESKTIEIAERSSCLSYKQIKLSEEPSNGTEPYSMVAYKGKVFISMYDGYLARLDTLTMTIDKSVKVGANPDQIAVHNGKIYVPISEGMSYPNYGKTACVVDPETMTVEKTFDTGLNPTNFYSTGGRLFLLCKGNYADVDSYLYEVNADYTITELCKASIVCAFGDSKLAVVYQPFVDWVPAPEFRIFTLADNKLSDWNLEKPEYVNQMYYDQAADKMLIASYQFDGMYPSYTLPCYVNVYNGSDMSLDNRYDLDTPGPACIFSLVK